MADHQLIYGIHAVSALLQARPEAVERLALAHNRQDKKVQQLVTLADDANVRVDKTSRKELDDLTQSHNHQGVVACCAANFSYSEGDIVELINAAAGPALILVLDGVQDPHNLGACLRSANAHGVTMVIAPKNRAVGLTPAVRKVACGAAELTPFIQVTNLARTMSQLQQAGIWTVGLDMQASESLIDIDFTGNIAIVMGSEGSGMRKLTKEHCDYLAFIPMVGEMESLNVSVSAGICLYEAMRQRAAVS